MNFTNLTAAAMAVLLASGCASTGGTNNAAFQAQLKQHEALLAVKIMNAKKPLCQIECPPEGCTISGFQCSAPDTTRIPQIRTPESASKYWANAAVQAVSVAAPVALGISGFKAMQKLANGFTTPVNTSTISYDSNSNANFGDSADFGFDSLEPVVQ